jgi:hypothetical protein
MPHSYPVSGAFPQVRARPDLARSCRRLWRISALLYGFALACLLLGGTFAFVLPALNN